MSPSIGTRPVLPHTKSGIEKRLTNSKRKNGKKRERERVERRQPTELPVKLIAEILKSFIIGDCSTIAQRKTRERKKKHRRCEWAFSFSLFKFIFREILLCVVRLSFFLSFCILLALFFFSSLLEYVPNI